MKLKTLTLAALIAFPSMALADGAIYVVRPDIPGVTAGVLPKTAFAASSTSPSGPGTPVSTPPTPPDDADVIWRSVSYADPTLATNHIDATVKLGNSYLYKSPITGPNLYCTPWMNEIDQGAEDYFYEDHSSTGDKIEFLKPNSGATWRHAGVFYLLMDCQTHDLVNHVDGRSFETLTVTTTN